MFDPIVDAANRYAEEQQKKAQEEFEKNYALKPANEDDED